MTLLLLAACEPPTNRTYPVFVDTSEDTDTGGDTSTTSGDTSDTSDTGGEPITIVTVNFEGRVQNVNGTPFGLDGAAVDATVSGFFTYDREVADSISDDQFSVFDHRSGTAPFTIAIEGPNTVFVSGSTNPVVAISRDSDTFAWKDGPQSGDGGFDRFCTVDGLEDPNVLIDLSFVPIIAQPAFANDSLPVVFPFVNWAIGSEVDATFTLEDGSGSLAIDLATVSAPL